MKVDGSINRLVQGVSQQSAKVRLDGQCDLQENLSSDPVDGLKDRPPVNFIKKLFGITSGTQFVDFSVGAEKFVMAVLSGSLRIFDMTGTERTVTMASGTPAYFDGNPIVSTSADNTTYLLNTSKVTAMQTGFKTYVKDGHSLVYLLGGQYGRDYKVRLQWGTSDITVTYSTPNGGAAADALKIATDNIATELETALNANGTIAAAFTITRESDVLYIVNDAGSVVETTVADGDGGANIFAVDYNILDESKVPRYAPQGFVVKLEGDSSSSSDDWYLEFSTDDSSIAVGSGFGSAGKWIESVAPDTEYLMDTSTMPHTLIIDSSGNFDVALGAWEGRQVGDADSNEDPGFIGKTINDIGSFQGRIVMLSGQRVIMSRTNKHLDFWLQSATTLADTDPIDIESTAKDVDTTMLKMTPHNRDLVVFSKDAQFIVFGRNTITPKNSSLVLTTGFEADLSASPVSAGKNVLFAIQYGTYTGVREFFTEGAGDIDNSDPITQHISKYMPGQVTKMAGTSNFNLFLLQTNSPDNKLYAYEYLWKNNKLLQSSWSTWIMPDVLSAVFFDGSSVMIVTSVGGSYVLGEINLDTTEDTGLTYQVKLDHKTSVTGVNTTFANPLNGLVNVVDLVFIQGAGCPKPGLRVLVDSFSSGNVTLEQDMQGGTVILGKRYDRKYIPTRPFVKDKNDHAIAVNNFKIRDYRINYQKLGYIKASKVSPYRATISKDFDGMQVSNPLTPLGQASVSDGTFRFPFGDDPDHAQLEIDSDSHLPMNLLDIDWTGQYSKLGNHIGG